MLKSIIARVVLFCAFVILPMGNPARSADSPLMQPVPPHLLAENLTSSNLKLVGHIGGLATTVAMQGNYAYLASNYELAIIDITDPGHPVRVGYITYPFVITEAEAIVLRGNYVYVASSNGGLQIIDVTETNHPVYLSAVTDLGEARALDVVGKYAYVLSWYSPGEVASRPDATPSLEANYPSNRMWVIDISDPSHPIKVGSYIPDVSTYLYFIAVSGQTAYIVNSYGLWIIDVSDPYNPVKAGSFDLGGRVWNIAIAGNFAYEITCGVPIDVNCYLNVIDISDPTHPSLLGVLGEAQNEHWGFSYLRVSGSYVYIAGSEWDWNTMKWVARLFVAEISEPTNPKLVGRMDTFDNSSIHDLAVDGSSHHLSTANWTKGWRIIDVSNPAQPVEVGSYTPPPEAAGVTISNGLAYVASYSGIRIVYISNPIFPHLLGTYDEAINKYPSDIAIVGNYAYVAAFYELWVLDVSDPGNISEVSVYPMDEVTRVTVTDHYAYALDRSGLHVLDITDPQHIIEVNHFEDAIRDIMIYNGHAYTFKMSQPGFLVLDVSKPEAPSEAGYIPGYFLGLTVSGNYAYLIDSDNKFWVVDISDPGNPTEVGYCFLPLGSGVDFNNPHRGMAVGGNLVYITKMDGMQVADVSDPTRPTDFGNYYSAAKASAVTTAGYFTYLADKTGLTIFQPSFSIAGRVTDGSYVPVPGVSLTVSSSLTTTTDAKGLFSFDGLAAGSYNIIPTLPGIVFWPPSRSLAIPLGYSAGQDFFALPQPVSTTLIPGITTTLTYHDIQGNLSQFTFPGNAITQTTVLTITPTIVPDDSGLAFVGHAFDISAYQNNVPVSTLAFSVPITATIQYSDEDVRVIPEENKIALQWWNGNDWVDSASTCSPPSPYIRDILSNGLSISFCRVGHFAMFGPTNHIWLSIIAR